MAYVPVIIVVFLSVFVFVTFFVLPWVPLRLLAFGEDGEGEEEELEEIMSNHRKAPVLLRLTVLPNDET